MESGETVSERERERERESEASFNISLFSHERSKEELKVDANGRHGLREQKTPNVQLPYDEANTWKKLPHCGTKKASSCD